MNRKSEKKTSKTEYFDSEIKGSKNPIRTLSIRSITTKGSVVYKLDALKSFKSFARLKSDRINSRACPMF